MDKEIKILMPLCVEEAWLEWRNSRAVSICSNINSILSTAISGVNSVINSQIPKTPVCLPKMVYNYYGNSKNEITSTGVLLYMDNLEGNRSADMVGQKSHSCSFVLVCEPPNGSPEMAFQLHSTISKATNRVQDNTQSGWSAWVIKVFGIDKGVKLDAFRIKKGGPGFTARTEMTNDVGLCDLKCCGFRRLKCTCVGENSFEKCMEICDRKCDGYVKRECTCLDEKSDPMSEAIGDRNYGARLQCYRDLFLLHSSSTHKAKKYNFSEEKAKMYSRRFDLAVYLNWFLKPIGGLEAVVQHPEAHRHLVGICLQNLTLVGKHRTIASSVCAQAGGNCKMQSGRRPPNVGGKVCFICFGLNKNGFLMTGRKNYRASFSMQDYRLYTRVVSMLASKYLDVLTLQDSRDVVTVMRHCEHAWWEYADVLAPALALPHKSAGSFVKALLKARVRTYSWILDDYPKCWRVLDRDSFVTPKFGALILNNELTRGVMILENGAVNWNLPKGKILQGENEVECIKREVLEETGLRIEDKHFLRQARTWQQTVVCHRSRHSHMKLLIVKMDEGKTTLSPKLKGEIRDVRWMPMDKVMRAIPFCARKGFQDWLAIQLGQEKPDHSDLRLDPENIETTIDGQVVDNFVATCVPMSQHREKRVYTSDLDVLKTLRLGSSSIPASETCGPC